MTGLSVPYLPEDVDTLKAALEYAKHGWYVGPVVAPGGRGDPKSPGSVLGKGWEQQTSRDPAQIASWFAGTDYGVFLHAGRSGAVIFDIDHPDKVPEVLARHLDEAPFQSSRPGQPGRGHAVFAVPPGRKIGNRTAGLGGDWGQVRGLNGVIIAFPSRHESPEGEYRWVRTGPVPVLADELAELLPDVEETAKAGMPDPASVGPAGRLLCGRMASGLAQALPELHGGPGRHDRMLTRQSELAWLAAEGHEGGPEALEIYRRAFAAAVAPDRPGKQAEAESEWSRALNGVLATIGSPVRPPDPCRYPLRGLIADAAFDRQTATRGEAAQEAVDPIEPDEQDGPPYSDVAAFLAGGKPEPVRPALLRRTDGTALFYAGKVNVLYGDPECGKSWIAYAAVAERLADSGRAVIIDVDHNGMAEIVGRLVLLGASEAALSDLALFRLYEPEDGEALLAAVVDARSLRPDVAVVDSIGELLPMLGKSSNSPDDFSIANRMVLTALAGSGAAVIAIDHMPKSPEARQQGQTGTMAKKRTVNGCALEVRLNRTFAPGRGGAAGLSIGKDRPGGLRSTCPPADRGMQRAGIFDMTPDLTGRLEWSIKIPSPADAAKADADVAELDALAPPPSSVRDLRQRLQWGSDRAGAALAAWRELKGLDS